MIWMEWFLYACAYMYTYSHLLRDFQIWSRFCKFLVRVVRYFEREVWPKQLSMLVVNLRSCSLFSLQFQFLDCQKYFDFDSQIWTNLFQSNLMEVNDGFSVLDNIDKHVYCLFYNIMNFMLHYLSIFGYSVQWEHKIYHVYVTLYSSTFTFNLEIFTFSVKWLPEICVWLTQYWQSACFYSVDFQEYD